MKRLGVLLILVVAAIPVGQAASAHHQWWSYHWVRSPLQAEVALPLVDSTTSRWTRHLTATTDAWSSAPGIDLVTAPGSDTRTERRACPLVPGAIKVCNASYGRNGWLGLTDIWVVGDEIVKARVRINDSYLARGRYSTSEARRHVLCHELGHAVGLDHQQATSCMDDENGLLDAAYTTPDAHDFEQLALMYGVGDGALTVGQATDDATGAAMKAMTWSFPTTGQPHRH